MFDETLLHQMLSVYLEESLNSRGWTLADLNTHCALSGDIAKTLFEHPDMGLSPEAVRHFEMTLDWDPKRVEKIYQTAGVSYLIQLTDESDDEDQDEKMDSAAL